MVAFARNLVAQLAFCLNRLGGPDKSVGIIYPNHFLASFGKLKRGAAGGTTNIKRADGRRIGMRGKKFSHSALREAEGADGTLFPWQDFMITAIVEEEVFINEALGFVEIGHGN